MLKQKTTIPILLLIVITGISLTDSARGYYDFRNMNEEEVLLLVENNEEIISWLEDFVVDFEEIWGWGDYWTVRIGTFNLTDYYYLEIIVNDKASEIISINYYIDGYRTWELDNKIVEWARKYLDESGYISFFGDTSENLNLRVSDFGRIEIHRWSDETQFSGILGFTHLLNETVQFHPIMFWSDSAFGNVSVNFDEALLIAENTSLFQNFNSNYTLDYYNLQITQYLDFDTPYLPFIPGYYIQVEKGTWDGDTILGFVDGEFIETNNYNYDYETSSIWIDNYKRVEAFINASDGTVTELNRNYLDPGSYAFLANLAMEDFVVSPLVKGMRKFHGDFYQAYNDIFKLRIQSDFSVASAEIYINATSGQIVDKIINTPIAPTRTESEILDIAYQNNEVQNLIQNAIAFDQRIYYDYEGTWRLEFYDSIMTEFSGSMEIDDISGEILYSHSWNDQPPNLDMSEVIEIALKADLRAFNRDHPEAQISMFFDWDRNWQVVVYDPIYVNSYMKIIVNDRSGELTNINDKSRIISTSNNVDDIRSYLHTLDEYKEFESLVGEKYEYIYYQDQWRIFLENIDDEDVKTIYDFWIRDSTLFVTDSYRWEGWQQYNQERIWPGDIVNMFENNWGFERLGKIIYTPLSEVIVEYTPTQPLPDESTENLDLPGFTMDLSISILFITTFFVKKVMRKKF